jgi:hypothetical protein
MNMELKITSDKDTANSSMNKMKNSMLMIFSVCSLVEVCLMIQDSKGEDIRDHSSNIGEPKMKEEHLRLQDNSYFHNLGH